MSGVARVSMPADWTASLPRRHRVTEAAAWALAACVVGGLFAGVVLAAQWLDARAGAAGVAPFATPIDLPPLAPAPAATAASDPAPDQPPVGPADPPDQMPPPDARPRAPAVTDAAVAPAAPPLAPRLASVAELPPDRLAPPPPVPDRVVAPPEVPAIRPMRRPAAPPDVEPVAQPVARPAAEPARTPNPTAARPAAPTRPAPQAATDGRVEEAASSGQVRDLKASWGAAIRKRIERRKSYPASAQGASGTVGLLLTVTRGGALQGVSVARSSGTAALDAAAVRAVTAAGRFPAAPAALVEPHYSLALSVTFSR